MKFTGETKMFFGKFKGVPLKDVPASYLLWCNETIEPIDPARESLLAYIEDMEDILREEIAGDDWDDQLDYWDLVWGGKWD